MNYLKRSALMCMFLAACTVGLGQTKPKYQGLLWEISGKQLKKPSYLFGTMHVSNKLAFHLSDSFYHCIRNADIVSLETDPQQLQEDFSKSRMLRISSRYMNNLGGRSLMPKDAFTIGPYGDLIRTGLTYRPEMINHLLYRSFTSQEDFEEDTFLDMYIYQVGKKLGKKATGVESFQESENLMFEAYRDAAKDKTPRRQRDQDDPGNSRVKLNDAYRRGDLDLLDSISTISYNSPAFLEKFMYKRNENMFQVIDSILHTPSSLFAGVGAAHLPGDRGLIFMLRKAGYTVRPVAISNRGSEQKEQLEKMKAPVTFQPYTSEDGWIQAELPGKLYNFSNLTMLHQLQYADLANGAYYLVSRIKTNALSLGQTEQDVLLKIDSLLYENIPGKIISKKAIINNGYHGFDISNRTRRGDLQRYNIFVTPFEVFIFKISGNGEYAAGEEATRFLTSVKLKPLPQGEWAMYKADGGAFSVKLPHTPVLSDNVALRSLSKRKEYEAVDKKTGSSYLIIRKTIPDYRTLEEDTVDLSFAEESYLQSQFIKHQKSRKLLTWQGHPCLEFVNQNTDNSFTQTRILLQGSNYYILSARYKADKKPDPAFFSSFNLNNPVYTTFEEHKDTTLFFTVKTAVKADKDDAADEMNSNMGMPDEEETGYFRAKEKTFASDSTGEEIIVKFERFYRYYSYKDSADFWGTEVKQLSRYGDFIVHSKKYEKLPEWESMLLQMRDTNNTRTIMHKIYLRKGAYYTLSAITDNISGPSSFVTTFFDTFTPQDTLTGTSIFTSKTDKLLKDFYSADSVVRKQARTSLRAVNYRDEDAPVLIRMIKGWSAAEKNYLGIKDNLIRELGLVKHPDVLPFLKQTYEAANDTALLQQSALTALMTQQTKAANALFSQLVLKEIPIIDGEDEDGFTLFDAMYDSLSLSAGLFPDLLQLTALTDYKEPVYSLLATLTDSGYIKPAVYAGQISQIAFDARVALQKELTQDQRKMSRREDEDEEDSYLDVPVHAGHRNSMLHNYAVMLLPFRQTNKNAERFFTRYETLQNPTQQILLAQLYLRNNLQVADSLLEKFAAKEDTRITLWDALTEIKRQDKFPAKYKKQEAIARGVLYNAARYNDKIDTLVYLNKQHTTHRFRKGTVYFYKYRLKDNDRWYLGISGMQPENEKECTAGETLTQLTRIPYQADKPMGEQYTKVLRHVKYKNRYGWDDLNNSGPMFGIE